MRRLIFGLLLVLVPLTTVCDARPQRSRRQRYCQPMVCQPCAPRICVDIRLCAENVLFSDGITGYYELTHCEGTTCQPGDFYYEELSVDEVTCPDECADGCLLIFPGYRLKRLDPLPERNLPLPLSGNYAADILARIPTEYWMCRGQNSGPKYNPQATYTFSGERKIQLSVPRPGDAGNPTLINAVVFDTLSDISKSPPTLNGTPVGGPWRARSFALGFEIEEPGTPLPAGYKVAARSKYYAVVTDGFGQVAFHVITGTPLW